MMNAADYGLENGKSLLVALAKVFKHPSQSLMEFNNECKKLTDGDKAWFKERFKAEFGIEVA